MIHLTLGIAVSTLAPRRASGAGHLSPRRTGRHPASSLHGVLGEARPGAAGPAQVGGGPAASQGPEHSGTRSGA